MPSDINELTLLGASCASKSIRDDWDAIRRVSEEMSDGDAPTVYTHLAARLAFMGLERGLSGNTDTFVIYVILRKVVFDLVSSKTQVPLEFSHVYVGKSHVPCSTRFKYHPRKCPELKKAFESSERGKQDWVCYPVLALRNEDKTDALLVILEEMVQRILKTVGTCHGLNVHYGNGPYGGGEDDETWYYAFREYVGFVASCGIQPSTKSVDLCERKLGVWRTNQRCSKKKGTLSKHREDELDRCPVWSWDGGAAPPTKNSEKIEMLLCDPISVATNGLLFSKDHGTRIIVDNMRQAYKRQNSHVLEERDRKIIDEFLPGIIVSGTYATFLHKSRLFAIRYRRPNALFVEPPKPGDDIVAYSWIKSMVNGLSSLTSWKKDVLEQHGLLDFVLGEMAKKTDKERELRQQSKTVLNKKLDKIASDSILTTRVNDIERQKRVAAGFAETAAANSKRKR